MILDIIKVIVLGIIEGLTEFLPVSSTGHLIIADKFIELSPKSFSNAFSVIIQLGAILSIVYLYFNELNPIAKDKLKEKVGENYREMSFKEKWMNRDLKTMRLIAKILIGFLPAAVLGFLFDDIIDKYLFNEITVSIALIFYGIVIIVIETIYKDKSFKYDSIDEISIKTVLLIGLFQCFAMVPGTSRSAATIIGAMILGCSRTSAAKFSFYLAIPTMLGATGLKVLKMGLSFNLSQWFLILLGGLVSYIVALIVIKKFLNYIRRHDFKGFGVYRIILGILVLVISFMGI